MLSFCLILGIAAHYTGCNGITIVLRTLSVVVFMELDWFWLVGIFVLSLAIWGIQLCVLMLIWCSCCCNLEVLLFMAAAGHEGTIPAAQPLVTVKFSALFCLTLNPSSMNSFQFGRVCAAFFQIM